MMKVLYIGNMADGTGYARAGTDYVLAMDSVGINVVPRLIHFNNRNCPLPLRITELMSQNVTDCNIVIQHTLPHLMVYNGHFEKNIGLFAYEVDDFMDSSWGQHLNLMDEVWVINEDQKEACIASQVTKPIHVVPHTVNYDMYQTGGGYIDLPCLASDFKFYTIGEFVRRKNFADLIKAFHTEFLPEEPVQLVLKTGLPNTDSNTSKEHIVKFCNEIKKGLKIWRNDNTYKNEIIITDFWSEKQILALHSTCHVFVTTSRGEAWNLGLCDAVGMQRPPIASDVGGHRAILGEDYKYLVECRSEPCFGAVDSFVDLYTARANWSNLDIDGLRYHMRNLYELYKYDKSIYESDQAWCSERIKEFSYEKVGGLIKFILEN
jgi:glycosyltransferase involved in cell wall biosynthesis